MQYDQVLNQELIYLQPIMGPDSPQQPDKDVKYTYLETNMDPDMLSILFPLRDQFKSKLIFEGLLMHGKGYGNTYEARTRTWMPGQVLKKYQGHRFGTWI